MEKTTKGLTSSLEAFLATEKGTFYSKSVIACVRRMVLRVMRQLKLTCDRWDTQDGREDCH
jgi:hypothetical protein